MKSSSYWFYDRSDAGSGPHNFLHYEIASDTMSFTLLAIGENELFLTNLVAGIDPRYYFRPGKKLNPYLFAGFNISLLDVHFENSGQSEHANYNSMEIHLGVRISFLKSKDH